MNSTTAHSSNRSLDGTSRLGGLLHTEAKCAWGDPAQPELLPGRDAKPARPAASASRRGYINLGGLDFQSIRLVAFCAELGCLSGAAKACNISLSTASHRLANLEKNVFKTRFFERDHIGLHPTEAGKVFCNHALAILATIYSAEQQLMALSATQRVAALHGVGRAQRG